MPQDIQIAMHDVIEQSGVRFGTSGARGLVSAMTDEVCFSYTAAFIQAIAKHGTFKHTVLGHDLRPSSPRIAAACATAMHAHGIQVIYAGALPTPALAYYAQQMQAPAIVVTGSHIPFDRNGIKFYRADGEISKADELAIGQAVVEIPATLNTVALPPINPDAGNQYLKRYVDFFGANALQGMRIAVYEHSSVARDILRKLLETLGASVISLGRTDVFVPIDTEAVSAEDAAQAKLWAAQQSFDAILSTDGDADRPLIGDEHGHWLRGDIVGILCAKFLKATVVAAPVSCNTALEKSAFFKTVIRTQIGSPYVIAAMEQSASNVDDVVVGFEANGGFLLGSDIQNLSGVPLKALPTRDAVLPMLALLAMSRQQQCPVSALAKSLPPRYTASDRIQNFATEKSKALIHDLQQNTAQASALLAPNAGTISNIDTTDGLRMTFSNQDIVHLRPSGNAPELRCYAESDTETRAQALCSACLNRLKLLE